MTQNSEIDKDMTPSLHPYIVIKEVSDSTGLHFILKEPNSKNFFRVNSQIGKIVQDMNGVYSISQLANKYNTTIDNINKLCLHLYKLNLLENHSFPEQTHSKESTSWIGRILFVRKDIINPDFWITRIYSLFKLRFIFSRIGLLFLLLVCIYGYWIFTTHTNLLIRSFEIAFQPQFIPLGWLVWAIVTILHELAHAFACKHYGGNVGAIGIGLYYFNLVIYCDVNDAWFFEKTSHRVITHGAGILMNLFLGALGIILLPLVTEFESLIAVGVFLFVISGIRSLVNLNPLIKLDGYFILADILGIYNLRTRAFTLFINQVKKFFQGDAEHSPVKMSKKERIIMNTYAFLSISYLLFLLVFLGQRLGIYLMNYINPSIAFLISYTLMIILFGYPFFSNLRSKNGTNGDLFV